MENIEKLLDYAIENGASDIHISTTRPSTLRIKGEIQKTDVLIDKEELMVFCGTQSMSLDNRINDFLSNRRFSVDSALNYGGRRFRLHLYKSNNQICAVLRMLEEEIPDLTVLNLPQSISKFVNASSGLILVCGATGSGKSTTIASIVDKINQVHKDVIITIEDPIEYIYKEANSVIEQREVGTHVESFNQATIDALREDPDIIVIGEMRDLDTIQNALRLAETGHLVFGTLHAQTALEAINRMVDVFPPEQQQQIRIQLAAVLFGIVHQQLITSKGKVVALCEILMVDSVIGGVITSPNKSQINSIKDYMRNRKDIGCVHIVENAMWHIKSGRLSIEDLKYILSEEDFRMLTSRLK